MPTKKKAKKTVPKVLVAMNLSEHPADIIEFAKNVNTCMGPPNVWFTGPPIPYTTFAAHIASADAATSAALGKAPGTVEIRDAAILVVTQDLTHLAHYAQLVADQNPLSAEIIIKSSGFGIKKTAVHPPRIWAVDQGENSGAVDLIAPSSGPGTTYFWQSCLTSLLTATPPGWKDAPATHVAKTSMTGLTPATQWSFRYKTLVGSVESDWSQVITIIVK